MKQTILIRNVLALQGNHLNRCSLFLKDGKIAEITVPDTDLAADTVIDGTNLTALPGLFDMHVHLRDPGQTHKEDIRLVEQSKTWVLSPERKASKNECEYAAKRLDGVITKITNAMKTTLQKIQVNLMKPEIRKTGTEQIKQKARTSILEKLNQNKEKIKRQNNMPNQKIERRKDTPEL